MTSNSVSIKPIIFSGEMVRALLEGRKTQTRRYAHAATERAPHNATWAPDSGFKRTRRVGRVWSLHSPYLIGSRLLHGTARCPYKPGDLLWVRETWRGIVQINAPWEQYEEAVARYVPDRRFCKGVEFKASHVDNDEPWQPSIHMPRWASRLTLRVTNVRAERLQDISEDDARAEGAHHSDGNPDEFGVCRRLVVQAKDEFRHIWEALYHKDSPKAWHRNPWVWVYEFEVIRKNVGEVP